MRAEVTDPVPARRNCSVAPLGTAPHRGTQKQEASCTSMRRSLLSASMTTRGDA
jgi:hypothetical protein